MAGPGRLTLQKISHMANDEIPQMANAFWGLLFYTVSEPFDQGVPLLDLPPKDMRLEVK